MAEQRDVKGLYGKARRGELNNFTGIDSPLRGATRDPHRHDGHEPEEAATQVVDELRDLGVLS